MRVTYNNMPIKATIIRPNLPFGCVTTYSLENTDGNDRKQIFEELCKYLKFKVNNEFTDKVTDPMPYKGGRLNEHFPDLKFERENSYFYKGLFENKCEYSQELCKMYAKNDYNFIKKKDMMLIMRQMNRDNWTVLYF